MHFEQPSKIVIWTNEGFGNAVAIDTGKLYFIDSMANRNTMMKFKEKVESIFNKKAHALLLTHHHGDHIFSNQLFKDHPIISSHETREILITWGNEVFIPEIIEDWENYSSEGFELVLPNQTFNKDMTFHDEHPMKFIRLDGHVEGASILWDLDHRIILASDLIFNHRFPYGADMTSDVLKWEKAIGYLINLNPELVISGHGPPATKDDLKEIKQFFHDVVKYFEMNENISVEEIIRDEGFPEYYNEDAEVRREGSIESWYLKFHPDSD